MIFLQSVTNQKTLKMIDYIKGTIIELTPTDTVVECYGIGYKILISLQTFSQLEGKKDTTIYIHHYLREDEEIYYGFSTKDERELFRLLIGVSGIGATTLLPIFRRNKECHNRGRHQQDKKHKRNRNEKRAKAYT